MGDVVQKHAPEPTEATRRRVLLRCLAAAGGEADIVQLSVACARELYDSPVTALAPETRRRLYRDCRETVRNGLAEQNLVEYSATDGTVRLRTAVSSCER
jgi:hypothetical protein